MVIGIPKEVKDQEYRVGIIPYGVGQLSREGHAILVEAGAGEGSGISDGTFAEAGAEIVSSKQLLFARADLIVKVKEPTPGEFNYFHKGQILFTYLHLAANRPLFDFLLEREVSAIAYDTIELSDGSRPLLKPMSAIAGRMAVLAGVHYLQRQNGGMGLLLSGVAGVPKGRVTIIGGGTVGQNAARTALALGAEVVVIEQRDAQRAWLDTCFRGRVVTLPPYPDEIAAQVKQSHLLIGAVATTGDKAPHLVTRKMVATMTKGAVIVDVAIDQGGCFETSRPTSHSDPVYTVDGVIHYCVTNMPGVVPRTATFALANATFPYLRMLAADGFDVATAKDASLQKGINVHQGKVIHPVLQEVFHN